MFKLTMLPAEDLHWPSLGRGFHGEPLGHAREHVIRVHGPTIEEKSFDVQQVGSLRNNQTRSTRGF